MHLYFRFLKNIFKVQHADTSLEMHNYTEDHFEILIASARRRACGRKERYGTNLATSLHGSYR